MTRATRRRKRARMGRAAARIIPPSTPARRDRLEILPTNLHKSFFQFRCSLALLAALSASEQTRDVSADTPRPYR